jgi:hypothetical protein
MTRAIGSAAALIVLTVAATGCGPRQIGAEAARGAVDAVEQRVTPDQPHDEGLVEQASREAVRGVLSEATEPEQMAQVLALVKAASSEAARAALDGAFARGELALRSEEVTDLIEEVSASAVRGLLDAGHQRAVEQLSAAAVRGVRDELGPLLPDCQGPDRERCVDQRVQQLSRAVSAGVTESIRGALAIPVLLLTFGLGALSALVLRWLFMRRGHTHVSR